MDTEDVLYIQWDTAWPFAKWNKDKYCMKSLICGIQTSEYHKKFRIMVTSAEKEGGQYRW